MIKRSRFRRYLWGVFLVAMQSHAGVTDRAEALLVGDGEPRYDRIYIHPDPNGADPEYLPRAFFGPQGSNTISFPALTGVPQNGDYEAAVRTDGDRIYCTQACIFSFPINVPSGAVIDSFGGNVYDAVGNNQVEVVLRSCVINGSSDCGVVSAVATGFFQTPGAAVISRSSSYVVDNSVRSPLLHVTLTGSNSATAFKNAIVTWRRQISPAPGSATFNDVPTGHSFFQAIEALAASGVTSGCGNGNYCPDGIVTRGQMAAFLARALGL